MQKTSENKKIDKILRHPKLLSDLIDFELEKQIVREKDTKWCIFLCSCGKLVKNANLTSYNLLVNSESGTGKDWITDKTLKIWPEDQVVKRTRISEKVFTYWHNPKFDPKWTWDGKVFYNEDIANHVLNSDVFKVMSSSGSKATVLVNQLPVDIEIVGKPVMIVTSATANPKPEIMRRFTMVSLDEEVEQTELIMARQAKKARMPDTTTMEYDRDLIEALGELKRVSVVIPYAESLMKLFPKDHVIMRTHFERFLDYIKASAALHQFQRQETAVGIIEAEGQDYDYARTVFLKVTSNPQMIPLTKNELRIYDVLKESFEKDTWASVSEISKFVSFVSDRTLRVVLEKLVNYGFLAKNRDNRENSAKMVFVYRLKFFDKVELPKWGKFDVSA